MPMQFKVKVVKIGNSLRITIPKEIAESIGLRKGDNVGLIVVDGEIRARRLSDH